MSQTPPPDDQLPNSNPLPTPFPSTPPATPMTQDEKTWGMFCHLAALAGYVVWGGWFIGPLVVWLIKKDQYAFVNDQGKESLNWQLTLLIGYLLSIPLCFICIGFVTLAALAIADLVFVIVAAVKANSGELYRYPWSIKFIK